MNFIDYLEHRLNQELPGIEAQKIMAPTVKENPFRDFTPKKNAKDSAVLVLLFPDYTDNNYNVLLTLRSKKISHSGQISFPGGRQENNETPVEAALREAHEEIGLSENNIKIIGHLSTLYVPPSNSIITPVLAFLDKEPAIGKINKHEVQEVIITDLKKLLSEEFLKRETWNLRNTSAEVPFWTIHSSTPLWGATAMMLMELLVIYRDYLMLKS